MNGLVPPGFTLLASCFDARGMTGGGLFSIGDEVRQIDDLSSTGLDFTNEHLYRLLWSDGENPARLLVYDADGMSRDYRIDGVSAPHGILAAGDQVVVVATHQNDVVWLTPDGEVTRRWHAPGEGDSWHLNSLVKHDDRLLVCAFGRYSQRRGWDKAGHPASGCVIDIDSMEEVLSGLKAPHDPLFADGSWLVCDSASGGLLELDPDSGDPLRRIDLDGWTRGLAITDTHAFVGLSPHRHAPAPRERAAVAVVSREKWEIVDVVEVPAHEVYALALVPDELVPGARSITHEASPLREFGIYPSAIAAAASALADGTALPDVVGGLLTLPSGAPDGLARARVAEEGAGAFAAAAAETLGVATAEVAALVPRHLGSITLTGAEAIALTFRAAGVRLAFGYAGTSELAVCNALARLGLLVNGRGDRESAFLAGGASLADPAAGAAVLHGARGLTNALGALGDIRRNEIGMVGIVGLPSTGSAPYLPPHGEHRLMTACGEFVKAAHEFGPVPEDASDMASAFISTLREAFVQARRPPCGPVLVGVPQDVAEQAWLPWQGPAPVPPPDPPARPGGEAFRRACGLVGAAGAPVILIDDFALHHDGVRDALADLSGRLGAPVLQVRYRRGPMLFERLGSADVPLFAGWYEPADPAHQALLVNADLLITVEDRNMYERVIGPLPPCRKIAITSDPSAVRKNGYDAEILSPGVVEQLRALADQLPPAPATLPAQAASRPAQAGPPRWAKEIRAGLVRQLSSALERADGNPILVDDSQMLGGLVADEYDQLPAGLRVHGDHAGFVGAGIAYATGLALSERSAQVVCLLGDQGFTNGVQGLVGAVQQQAPVTFLVCNNGRSVSLGKQAAAAGSRWFDDGSHDYLVNAPGLAYAELATAFGVHSRRVDLTEPGHTEEFGTALRGALALRRPALVEVVLPSSLEFWTGIWITSGFEEKPAAHA